MSSDGLLIRQVLSRPTLNFDEFLGYCHEYFKSNKGKFDAVDFEAAESNPAFDFCPLDCKS